MAINYDSLKEKILNVIAGHGISVEKRDESGNVTSEIEDIKFFSSASPYIVLSVDEGDSEINLKVDKSYAEDSRGLHADLKKLANEYAVVFDYKIMSKNRTPKEESYRENQMSEVNELRKLAGLPEQEPVAETEQLDEVAWFAPVAAALGTAARVAGPKALQGLKSISQAAGNGAVNLTRGGATGAAKVAGKHPVGTVATGAAVGTGSAINDVGQEVANLIPKMGDGVGAALDSVEGYAAQIAAVAKQVGATIASNETLIKIATLAKQYALPVGLVIAAIWGGKKILDKIFDDVNYEDESMVEAEENVMEGFGSMTGSSKTSYQGLDNVKLIVKHKAPVNEESRGARSRNIHSIYVQRGEERFKMSENNLKAARAMARHLQMGGETFDSVGSAITEMAAEQRKLSEFARYVTKRGLVNETNEEFVTIAKENIANIKGTLDRLCGVKSYATAVESLQDMANVEILEDDLDLEAKFTETHFDNKVADAMDSLKRSMSRRNSFESAIRTAIQKESFANLKDMLSETGVVDFASPHARLSHQVSQMGHAAQNPMLRNHLMGISKKIDAGQGLGQFEYDTIKSCLLSAREARVQEGNMYESANQDWENFLEKYDIL